MLPIRYALFAFILVACYLGCTYVLPKLHLPFYILSNYIALPTPIVIFPTPHYLHDLHPASQFYILCTL